MTLASEFSQKDRMTPGERMKALKQGRAVDRPPYIPLSSGFSATLFGIDIGEYYRNPESAFAAGLNLSRVYPWMNARPTYGWADRGAWEFGGDVVWPDNGRYVAPLAKKPVIQSPEDVDRLIDPDPDTAGMNPLVARFNNLCRKKGFPASLPGGTPTTLTGGIVGRTNFYRWLIKYPEAVLKLQRKVTDFLIATAKRTIELYGAENCSVTAGVPMESNQLMSPKSFEKFCKPYIQEIIGYYVSSGVSSVTVHLCGDHTRNLQHWKDIPIPPRTTFSIGYEMDLEATGKMIGSDHILAGNIHTTLIHLGSREELTADVIRCLNAGMKHPGGFVLMPSCGISALTPQENMEIIGNTIVKYGYY